MHSMQDLTAVRPAATASLQHPNRSLKDADSLMAGCGWSSRAKGHLQRAVSPRWLATKTAQAAIAGQKQASPWFRPIARAA